MAAGGGEHGVEVVPHLGVEEVDHCSFGRSRHRPRQYGLGIIRARRTGVEDAEGHKENRAMVMTERYSTKSAEIRGKLDYPVVDCDGHIQEMVPVMADYVSDVAGADKAKEWLATHRDPVTVERPGQRVGGAGWWNLTANTDDYAS